jgi:hypothetical protein
MIVGEQMEPSLTESESSRDEDRANTLESMSESFAVTPVKTTNVMVISTALGSTATDEDTVKDVDELSQVR